MKRIGFVLMLSLMLTGVNTISAKEKLKGNGKVEKEIREIGSFSGITVNGVFHVLLTQGDKESLEIEADENLLDYIITKVDGKELIIEMKPNVTVKSSKKLNVYITLKSIDKITLNGVGNVHCENALVLTTLKIDNSGVGNISLKGTADNFTGGNYGVGNIRAFDFEVQNCELKNSGVGNVDVNVKNNLKVINSGVGDITYTGEPKMVDINSNGVGKVRKK